MQTEAVPRQQPPKASVEAKPGQQKPNAASATLLKPPSPDGYQGGHGCPGTNQSNLDCNVVMAIAATRQANAADRFNDIVWVEIGVGAFTALFAYLAARWARKAAEAARETVDAFTAVETAGVHVTLDSFQQGPGGLSFKARANNIGRSSALIVHAGCGWSDNMGDGEVPAVGPPKSYIVKPNESALLHFPLTRTAAQLQDERFLWILVTYNSPPRGSRWVRYCFEIWGLNSSVPYLERRRKDSDYFPKVPKNRKWWHFLAPR